MQLSDRSFMIETRYSQSFGDLSARKNKLLSTGFTKKTMNTTMALPKISRSHSFSCTKSAKQRMTNINEVLDQIKTKTDQLRMDTRESRRYVNFLKDDLVERELNQNRTKLSLQIKKLDNGFKFTKKQHQDRTGAIKHDCRELTENSKSIIDLLDKLKSRLDNLEEMMGIYSGKEKHKF